MLKISNGKIRVSAYPELTLRSTRVGIDLEEYSYPSSKDPPSKKKQSSGQEKPVARQGHSVDLGWWDDCVAVIG